MPIYEYSCEECDENFEKLVRIAGFSQVTCPNCGSDKTRKKISTFASRGEAGSASYAAASSSCSTGST